MTTLTPTSTKDSPAAGAEQRLGVLSADRPCAGCGFNLHGATIVREPHYRLICVRCPECGTVAALQEYPAIAAWAGRWRMLMAAALVAVALLAVLVTGLISWGVSEGVSQTVCNKYAYLINAELQAHQQKTYPDTQQPRYLSSDEVKDWWKSQPPSAVLERAGGWLGALNWWGLLSFTFIGPLFVVIGVFWSVMFVRARKGRLMLIGAASVGLGLLFFLAERYSGSANSYYFYYGSGYQFASVQVGWLPAVVTMVLCLLALWAGVLIGRGLARWVVATLLPPRLLAAFSFLWLADGRALPRG